MIRVCNFPLAFILLIFLLPAHVVTAQAQQPIGPDGLKFGYFDVERAAAGVVFSLGRLSPHLQATFDGDLIFTGQPRIMLDFSIRYLFDRQQFARPYVGGGAGVALGEDNAIPAHLIGGFDFSIDALPLFIELKIHLSEPDAASIWFGIRL